MTLSEELKWAPIIEKLLWQNYYRILSFISFHGPISESYVAATSLIPQLGGNIFWVVENRIFRWDNVEISPGITMTVWFFGGPRNTVMARRGWWSLYLFDVASKLAKE